MTPYSANDLLRVLQLELAGARDERDPNGFREVEASRVGRVLKWPVQFLRRRPDSTVA